MSAQVSCHKCRVYWTCLVLSLLALVATAVVTLIMLTVYDWQAWATYLILSLFTCSFIALILATDFAKHRVVTDGVNSS